MAHATEVMRSVMLTLQRHLQTYEPNFPVGDFILSGSVADGAKVCAPDEFDILVPIRMPGLEWDEWDEKYFPDPELATFKRTRIPWLGPKNVSKNYWLLQTVVEQIFYDHIEIQTNDYISPEKVARQLQELLFKGHNFEGTISSLRTGIKEEKRMNTSMAQLQRS